MALDAFKSYWMMMMMMMMVPVPGDAYSKHLKTMSEPQTIRKFACLAPLLHPGPWRPGVDLHDADDMSVSLSKGKDFKAAWQPFQPFQLDLCTFGDEVLSRKHAETPQQPSATNLLLRLWILNDFVYFMPA